MSTEGTEGYKISGVVSRSDRSNAVLTIQPPLSKSDFNALSIEPILPMFGMRLAPQDGYTTLRLARNVLGRYWESSCWDIDSAREEAACIATTLSRRGRAVTVGEVVIADPASGPLYEFNALATLRSALSDLAPKTPR